MPPPKFKPSNLSKEFIELRKQKARQYRKAMPNDTTTCFQSISLQQAQQFAKKAGVPRAQQYRSIEDLCLAAFMKDRGKSYAPGMRQAKIKAYREWLNYVKRRKPDFKGLALCHGNIHVVNPLKTYKSLQKYISIDSNAETEPDLVAEAGFIIFHVLREGEYNHIRLAFCPPYMGDKELYTLPFFEKALRAVSVGGKLSIGIAPLVQKKYHHLAPHLLKREQSGTDEEMMVLLQKYFETRGLPTKLKIFENWATFKRK